MDKLLPKNCTSMSLAMSGVVLTLENNEVITLVVTVLIPILPRGQSYKNYFLATKIFGKLHKN